MTNPNSNSVVSIDKCSSYSNDLEKSVFRLLNDIDSSGALISPGKKIIIKPNLLTDRNPADAVTTHPEVVRSIIRFLKKRNAVITVADSPASAVKVDRVWQTTGFTSLCQEENVPLISLEEAGSVRIATNEHVFNIAKPIMEADLIISVPKVKTHTLTVLTAGVKNYYGTLPGYQKANMHKAYPRQAAFGGFLRDLYAQMPHNINLADGIIGMEGNGPSGGTPVTLGFLAASTDAVALDLTLCRILKINPATVPYLNSPLDNPKSIELRGFDIKDITPASFKLPNTMGARLFPKWLMTLLDPFVWVRPAILDNCIACGRCVKACPANALVIDKELKRAVLTPDKCISCCCCHEVCPEKAIEMALSPLINFVRKGKKL